MTAQACRVVLALLLAVACAGVGCDRQSSNPPYLKATDEALMERAMAKARATHDQLRAALQSPQPSYRGFSVKRRFPTPDGGGEHIWINEITWTGSAYEGVVNNEPVETKAVKLGDRVTVTPAELSDWMFIDGRRVVGGYTLRVLHYQESAEDQRAFVEQTGLVVPPVDF